MDEEVKTDHQFEIAKIILITSFASAAIVLAVVFVFRAPLAEYIQAGAASSVPVIEESTVTTEPLVDMIAAAEPAVVSVIATKDVPVYEQYVEQLDPWGFWTVPRLRSQGTEEREIGGGSGFVVSEDGLIVTNHHVVADTAARYSIILSDGASYEVDVLASDPAIDIAVLKISEPIIAPLTALSFGDSTNLHLGETVVAIGNALAEFQNSVSVGVVSGLSRSITASDELTGMSERLDQVIQTDAAVNPGNSGGPLLNARGEVIGVNVATSRGADNISFALPAHVVAATVDSVRQYGEIVRPYLGVRYTTLTPALAEKNGLPVTYGALIAPGQVDTQEAVLPNSPAATVGLKENDIILMIDGIELRDTDLALELRKKQVGDTVSLKVLSNGAEKEVTVTLERMPVE
jgi:serine protease Do